MITFGENQKRLPNSFFKNEKNVDIWLMERHFISYYKIVDRSTILPENHDGEIGYTHQVILFHSTPHYNKYDIKDTENFICGLLNPPYYISGVVDNNYLGMVIRLYEGSEEFHTRFFNEYQKKPNKMFIEAYNKFLESEKHTNVQQIRN